MPFFIYFYHWLFFFLPPLSIRRLFFFFGLKLCRNALLFLPPFHHHHDTFFLLVIVFKAFQHRFSLALSLSSKISSHNRLQIVSRVVLGKSSWQCFLAVGLSSFYRFRVSRPHLLRKMARQLADTNRFFLSHYPVMF